MQNQEMKLELNKLYTVSKNPSIKGTGELRISHETFKAIEGDCVKVKGYRTDFKLIGNKLHRKNEIWVIIDTHENIDKAIGGSYNEDGSFKSTEYWSLINSKII